MDPLTVATSFATIVSLIGMYRTEKSGRDAESYEDFLAWLRTHRHDQIVEMLSDNQQIGKSTRGLIEAQHDEVKQSLEAINEVVCNIAAQIQATAPLASAMAIESSVSDQAVGILAQLNGHDASTFLESCTLSGTNYLLLNGDRGELKVEDERFIEDDLNTLCEYGLLRFDINSQGCRIFHLTRNGAKLGEKAKLNPV
jgi:hypothetical protein